MQLFVDRARQARPDFQITVHNAPHIAALCARLEGIPLALELTAAWAQMLSPAQMLQRLGRRFDLVASRRKDLPARHRTLRAAIEWSFRLLPPALQTFFARLAVFHGGWTIEAAEAVCEEPDAFDFLTQLRQHSLILMDEDDSPYADVRFRMLETLREYAQEQITPEQRAQAQSRHLEYYATMAQTASRHLLGHEQTAWLYRLGRDNDNIRAAFGVAQASPENQQYALRLASSLWRFWEIRGYYSEGRARCADVLALPAIQAPSVERAMVCNGAGNLAYHQGDNATARQQWEASLAIMQTLGHKRGMSIALGNLGNLASDQGDYARARALYTQSLDIKREIGGDPAGQAITLSNLGNVHMRENDFEGARDLYRQALRLHENAGNVGGKLIALVSLAAAANTQAQYEEARVSYYDALLLCRQLGERLWSALSLEGMARIAAVQNRDTAAVRLYAAAAALRDAINTPIDPEDKEARDADLDTLSRRMNPADYAASAQQGRALTWEQALADALHTMQDAPADARLPDNPAVSLVSS